MSRRKSGFILYFRSDQTNPENIFGLFQAPQTRHHDMDKNKNYFLTSIH